MIKEASDRQRLFGLLGIMMFTVFAGVSISIYTLYQTALDEQSLRLTEIVQSRARVMEAMARFSMENVKDYPGGAKNAAIDQIIDAHNHFGGFGRTGEFVLARNVGDQIVFLLRHRHGESKQPQPIPLDSPMAEPMRYVLMGKEGVILGPDYRGEKVLAAVEYVQELDLGLVAKIDMAEIQSPFIRAGSIALSLSIILVLIGVYAFITISNPVLDRLRRQSTYLEERVADRTSKLRSSEQKYRNLFERSMDVIYVSDASGRFIELNQAGENLFGYAPKEWENREVYAAYVDLNRREIFKKLMLEQGHVMNFRVQYKHADGHIIDSLENSVAIFDSDGKIIGYQGILRDISEENRQLKEIERLANFPALNPLPVIEIEANGELSYGNPATDRLLASLPENERNARRLLSDEYVDIAIECLRTGEDLPQKEVMLKGVIYLWSGRVMTDLSRIHFYATDITSLKLTEIEMIQAKNDAEKANHFKSIFMANMSHEIRTPLNSILGFTQMIEHTIEDKIEPEEKDYFQYIYKSGERLTRTVHEILDISQIEAGTFPTHLSKQHLQILIDQVLKEYEQDASEKGLSLTQKLFVDDDLIETDEYAVTQALSNLVDNAIKYTNRGGIELRLQSQNGHLLLEVEDTGIGIAEEYLERMFEPFSQESEGFTKEFQGVGLGLALVKRYLNLNNIELTVNSEKDKGSIFTLQFKQVAETQSSSDIGV